jgi:hypothetical protein
MAGWFSMLGFFKFWWVPLRLWMIAVLLKEVMVNPDHLFALCVPPTFDSANSGAANTREIRHDGPASMVCTDWAITKPTGFAWLAA